MDDDMPAALRDPTTTLAEILRFARPRAGDTVIALVEIATQRADSVTAHGPP